MLIVGAVLLVKNPELLRKRLKARENEVEQKGLSSLSGLMFVAGSCCCGLDYRFQWLVLPGWLVTAAAVVFVVGYLLFVGGDGENEYLSRTVEVQEDQTVVDSGFVWCDQHPDVCCHYLDVYGYAVGAGRSPRFLCSCFTR